MMEAVLLVKMRNKITSLLTEVGEDYKKREIATFEIHQGHDVHAFYRLPRNVENLVHVQSYPGMSTEHGMRVFARLMDYNKMMQIRRQGGISIGNEHEAVVSPFPNFEHGVMVHYDMRVLEGMIGYNVPQLMPLGPNMFRVPELEGQHFNPKDKRSLRDYLKTIDLRDPILLRAKSEEIMNHVREIMTPYVKGERGEPLQGYYTPAVNLVEEAFRIKDFCRSFPQALDFMIGSVEWE